VVAWNFLAKIKILAKSSIYSKLMHRLRKVIANALGETVC